MISFFKRNHSPVICERSKHGISRADIDVPALQVLYKLSKAGYTAYLVGGSVRDLLLKRQPKDFDVGTDARPNEIRRLFRNCFLIGKRFRLAHIVFGRQVIETSTFRRQPDSVPNENGFYQIEDNTFGSPEEDAKRRDFTVNGLFYDIKTFAVIDYVGGLKDLERKMLRSIGDPNVRFREDPVRMLRAIKFAARLDFTIERGACKAIERYHADILNATKPRVSEEIFRLFGFSAARDSFFMMWKYRLMQDLMPSVHDFVAASGGRSSPLWALLAALDQAEGSNELTSALRLTTLIYLMFEKECRATTGANRGQSGYNVARAILRDFTERLNVPKARQCDIIDLLLAIQRFGELPGNRRQGRFISNPIFPEAIALQKILLTAGYGDATVFQAWEKLYVQHLEEGFKRRGEAPGEGAASANPRSRSSRGDRRRRPRRRTQRPHEDFEELDLPF